MFFVIILSIPIVAVLWWWWANRRLSKAELPRWTRVVLGIFVSLHLIGYAALFASRGGYLKIEFSKSVLTTLYIWHMIAMPIAVGITSLVAVGGGWKWFRAKSAATQPDTAGQPTDGGMGEIALSRRQILAAGAVGTPFLIHGGAFASSLHQLETFRVREITVPVKGLPEALVGATLAHVTDTHVGKFTNGKILKDIADRVNALRCDLVLFTGDLLDYDLAELPTAIEMSQRFHAPGGVFFCEGNHDLFQSRERFESGCKQAGLNLLVNESALTTVRGERVQILGLRWGSPASTDRGRGAGIEENMAVIEPLRDPTAFQILLGHHPHTLDAAAEAGIPLTLGGHTHGGQLNLTETVGFGPMLYKYWSGLYIKPNGCAGVIGNGTGNWFPLRVRSPAEVLKLTLVRAE